MTPEDREKWRRDAALDIYKTMIACSHLVEHATAARSVAEIPSMPAIAVCAVDNLLAELEKPRGR